MKEPKVTIAPHDIYLLRVSKADLNKNPEPYNFKTDLDSYTHISAVDWQGRTIPLDSNHFILDMSQVDYSETGTYYATISVLDDFGHMKLDYLTVHVLSDQEAKMLDDADDDQNNYEKKRPKHKKKKPPKRKKKPSEQTQIFRGGILPKDPEKRLRLSDNTFLAKSNSYEEDEAYEKSHIFDKGSNRIIWSIVGLLVLVGLFGFWKMFF